MYGFPGIGASIRKLGTAIARAISLANAATLFTFIPGASCILICITVGPTRISAKNASISDYRRATGFEALMGYLYMSGRYERMCELIKDALDYLESEKSDK